LALDQHRVVLVTLPRFLDFRTVWILLGIVVLATSFPPISVSAADANTIEVITLVDNLCGTPEVGDPIDPKILCVRPAVSANNALIAELDVTVNTPSNIFVVYENPQTGRFRTKTTTAAGTEHTISLMRLKALDDLYLPSLD